jgi:hypothetical protein
MEAREKITLFLILIFFFFCIIFSQNQKANARRSLNSFSENDPLTQFNQTSSINITGVASTLDQATIDSNGRKICIEVANKFHHSENYAERRIEHFAKYGWKCLVVWEDELEDEQKLSEKIRVFMNGEN